jgi:hypothetical protein
MRTFVLLLALSVVLVACNQDNQGNDASSDSPTPSQEGTALVIGETQSPLMSSLEKIFVTTQADGSQDLSDFDAIILDGDVHTPNAINEHALIQNALRLGKWVIALDVVAEHKRDGLGALVHAASDGKSHAYAVRISQDALGKHQAEVVELPATVQMEGSADAEVSEVHALRGAAELNSADLSFFTDAFAARVEAPVLRTLQASDDLPAGLIYTTFYYSQIVPWIVGNAGRKDGTQDTGYQANYTFTVFLNNKNNPQGDFQYVLVDADLSANPTRGTGNFLNMYARSGTDWAVKTYDEMAWFQDRAIVEVEPYEDPAYPYTQGWISVATSPETANNVSTVTSSVNFSIGYNQAQGGFGSFGYSKAVSHTLTDWRMTNESSDVKARWNYRTATPVDADITYNSCAQPFFDDGCYMSRAPNDLSMNTLQLHTQAVWRTPATVNNWVGFTALSEHHMADLYCAKNLGFGCDVNAGRTMFARAVNRFGLNLGAVVPIPIASLTFTPNPVVAGQSVTGKVALQSPAQVDTPIQLQSNSQNATVLPTVIVRQGETSATFQVKTNANNLVSGNSTVATVTAFYADDFQTQLTIQAP